MPADRSRHVRDALRDLDAHLSGHTWQPGMWRNRRVMVCADCGYIWKPTMDRPSKDCPRPGGNTPRVGQQEGGSAHTTEPGRRLSALAEDTKQRGQRDDADLDEQHNSLGGVHNQSRTLKPR
jgi:hypothetical protein